MSSRGRRRVHPLPLRRARVSYAAERGHVDHLHHVAERELPLLCRGRVLGVVLTVHNHGPDGRG